MQADSASKSEEAVESFFAEEERILNDLAGASGFTFKRGASWSLNPETGEATYDPKFFEERGYTPSQALFGAFHAVKCRLAETAELLSTRDGQEARERLKDRSKARPRLNIWERCRTDVKGNLAIMRFAPSLRADIEAVHREKLWPETDLTSNPKHLQFMYAILRTAMAPDEQVTIDITVQEAIARLRDVKGKDVISLATDPALDALLALRLSEAYIEPVIEELYQEDLQDKKDREPEPGQDNSQAPREQPFGDDYRDFENRNASPLDEAEMERKIQEAQERLGEAAREAAAYEVEHGVSRKDVADYCQEYRLIEHLIEPLREIFRRIIAQRQIAIRRLTRLREEGVMIDPGLVAQTYLDARSGIAAPRTMKDFEGHIVEENVTGKFSVRLVADQSGSMRGEKSIYQRRSAILVMEAMKEFCDILDEELTELPDDLDIQTELRGFGVPEGTRLYHPLSRQLSEKQRLDFFKGLLETLGGTNDYDTLAEIEKDVRQRISLDPAYAAELQSGKRREIVIVLSDGDSGNVAEARKRAQLLRDLKVKVVGLGMGSAARGIEVTYAPDGRICHQISDLPKAVQELLAEYLSELSPLARQTGET